MLSDPAPSLPEIPHEIASDLEVMARLHRLSTRLVQTGELHTLLGEIIEAGLDLTRADKGNIQLFQDSVLRIMVHRGFDAAFVDFFNTVQHGSAACGTALDRNERVIVENVAESSIFAGTTALEVMLTAQARAVQSTPLVSRSGQTLGMFSTHYVAPQRPSERDLQIIDLLARQAADLIERYRVDEERGHAEKRLLQNEQMLTTLVENCPFGIYIVDSTFKIAKMNQRSQDGAFINVRPVIGRPFDEAMRILWPEKVADEIITTFRKTLETGEPYYSREFFSRRSDVDQWEAYEWELHRIALPDGDYGVICYYYDSTQLRNAERGLRDATHALKQTLETAATGLTRCSRDMHYISANSAYAQIAGKPLAQIVGAPIVEVMGTEAFEAIRPYVERVLKGECVEYETEIPFVAAGSKWLRVIYKPWREADDSVSGWVATIEDISSRKRAEEKLRLTNAELCRANEDLKRSEDRFRLAFESSPSGMIMVDKVGKILLLNSQTERLFGYDREELLGQSIDILVPSDVRAKHPGHRDAFLSEPKVRPMGAGRELYGLRKDGTQIPVEIGLNPLVTEGETCVIASIVDISARKCAEEISRSNDKALAALEAKNRFLSTVSHEVRTPMSGVIGLVEMMSINAPTEDMRFMAKTALDTCKRLLQILNDLLDASKLQAGAVSLEQRSFAVWPIIGDVVQLVLPQARQNGIQVYSTVSPDVPQYVCGDELRIRQIIQNLAFNAVKFTHHGQIEIRLDVVMREEACTTLKFSVTDSGIGISDEQQKRLFEPFVQAADSTTRIYGGTGLGLNICRMLTELMGGEIGVTSKINQGSTFWVVLPLREDLCKTR
jgi:PAS domain S-box-containing protein